MRRISSKLKGNGGQNIREPEVPNFINLAANKSNLKLLGQLHKSLVSLHKDIQFRAFPIYIRYTRGDKNIALLYFGGKFLKTGELELGINIGNAKRPIGFGNGKHMKYPGINCSIKFIDSTKLNQKILDAINLVK